MRFSRSSLGIFFALFVSATSARGAVGEPTSAEPEWITLAKRGVRAKMAGELHEAASLFAQADKLNPRNPVVLRGACEVALALEARGEKISSRNPCHQAVTYGVTAEDMRNEVASLLAQPKPTLDDLVTVSLLVDAAAKKSPDLPWGYLARCDLAHRLGDADLMEWCLSDLRRVSPQHTGLAQTLSSIATPNPWRVWSGRALVLLILLGTTAHATMRRLRLARRGAKRVAGSAVALVVLACGLLVGDAAYAARRPVGPAAGNPQTDGAPTSAKEDLGAMKINDADPESSVPSLELRNKEPLQYGYFLQDLAARLERAWKRQDHAAAIRYLRAITMAAPKSAYGPRMLCKELQVTGDLAKAVMACRTALTLDGSTADDFARFVEVALARAGQAKPTPLERKEIDAVIAHLAASGGSVGTLPALLRCEVGVRFEDTAALEGCTAELAKAAPDDPKTISFQWALALAKRDASGARGLIGRAKQAGVSTSGLDVMERATKQMRRRQIIRFVVFALSAAALAAGLTVIIKRIAARRRVRVAV
jgi:hypothetical protein